MAMTFVDQQSKLSRLLGDSNTSADDAFPLADRKFEINRGEVHFARDSKIKRNYATDVITDKEIAVPSDWLENYVITIDNKIISNNREISLTDWERFHDWGGDNPYFYFWEFSGTRKLKFLGSTNINGKTYQLFYIIKPTTDLNADSDESVFPDEYREASVYYAANELLKQQGLTQRAAEYLAVYSAYVQNAKDDVDKQIINKEYAIPDIGDGSELNDDNDTVGGGSAC